MSNDLSSMLSDIAAEAPSRFDLWVEFINEINLTSFAEIGVWRGAFAEQILKRCPSIERYYMVDPWQHLDHWNKPANVSDREFDDVFEQALKRTEFAGEKRIVLRAKTSEAILGLADAGLDAVYIDGDHTLRGITIDLVSIYDKIRPRGFIFGDDFAPSIWQHSGKFEPTFVFPLAVYFAEAKGDTIYGLPFNQFLIAKSDRSNGFQFHDLTRRYNETTLRRQLLAGPKGRARKFVSRLRSSIVRRLHYASPTSNR